MVVGLESDEGYEGNISQAHWLYVPDRAPARPHTYGKHAWVCSCFDNILKGSRSGC